MLITLLVIRNTKYVQCYVDSNRYYTCTEVYILQFINLLFVFIVLCLLLVQVYVIYYFQLDFSSNLFLCPSFFFNSMVYLILSCFLLVVLSLSMKEDKQINIKQYLPRYLFIVFFFSRNPSITNHNMIFLCKCKMLTID